MRAALQLGLEDDHRAVTYVGVACSGSEVTFGLFLQYAGNEWVPNPTDMSQISAIASAQCDEHEAPMQDLPEAYHMDGTIPELKGGLVLRKCDPINARKHRSDVRVDRRQRRRLLAPARQLGARR